MPGALSCSPWNSGSDGLDLVEDLEPRWPCDTGTPHRFCQFGIIAKRDGCVEYEAGESGIRMTDLAGNIVLSKSGVTTLVDRLEKRGWSRRVADPEDRRALRVKLTDEGVEVFRDAAEIHIASIQRHFADYLSDDEAVLVAEILERVHEDVRATDHDEVS